MRHVIVNRIVVVLSAVLVAAVMVFAWAATRPVPAPRAPEGPSGADLFGRHCAMCHDAEDIGHWYRERDDRDAAIAEFREFLEDHYGPSPEGNALIVTHVMAAGDP